MSAVPLEEWQLAGTRYEHQSALVMARQMPWQTLLHIELLIELQNVQTGFGKCPLAKLVQEKGSHHHVTRPN